MWDIINRLRRPASEWDTAKHWAEVVHPGWVYLATQPKKPELREVYREKILSAYRNYSKKVKEE